MVLSASSAIDTARKGSRPSLVMMAGPALRIVSEDWSLERAVFAADEVGWLAEEAQRHFELLGLASRRAAVIADPHREREPFRRLLLHPRLLHRALGVLRSPIAIARVSLMKSVEAPRLDLTSGELAIIVALGSSPDVRLGDIVVARGGEAPALRFEWPFIAIYRAEPTSQLSAEDDDCLWPSPWVVAG